MTTSAQAVGGRLFTGPYKVLLAIVGVGFAIVVWRFAVGLGPTTALSDGYPFGLWIAFDVVTGTALACGGYAVAILLYVLNKGRYHPLIRPAILTSALGYSVAGLAIAIDIGRPWLIHRVPLYVKHWNFDSAMLEVALCVMAYIVVLWIELSPAFLEKWKESDNPRAARFFGGLHAFLEKALIWIIALGLLLPTMHQSSLGSLMMLTGPKLHPLWQTPLLPLLFLVSCVAMGYAVVVFESSLSAAVFKRRPETPMLGSLYGAAVVTVLIYVVLRFFDVIVRGHLPEAFAFDFYSILFWFEIALFVAPALMYLKRDRRQDLGYLFRGAMLLALAGTAYRFNTYLVAFDPGPEWTYFPAVPETLVTIGIVALEIAIYVFIVKRYPILGGAPAPRLAHQGGTP